MTLAIRLAGEPPDPEAPSYRDVHPYAGLRASPMRPYSIALIRTVQNTVSGKWETERVAKLVQAAEGHRWSLIKIDDVLRETDVPMSQKDDAFDLLIHAYLQTMS